MKNEMTAGAEHVLAHGTARTRAAAGKGDGEGKKAEAKGGGKKAKGKKKIKRMIIEPADDGSHVIRHEQHQPEAMGGAHKEDEVYTAPDTEALKQHIEEHLGGGDANPAGEEPGGEEQEAEEAMAGGEGGAAGASAA